jgi:hypothetical protein
MRYDFVDGNGARISRVTNRATTANPPVFRNSVGVNYPPKAVGFELTVKLYVFTKNTAGVVTRRTEAYLFPNGGQFAIP